MKTIKVTLTILTLILVMGCDEIKNITVSKVELVNLSTAKIEGKTNNVKRFYANEDSFKDPTKITLYSESKGRRFPVVIKVVNKQSFNQSIEAMEYEVDNINQVYSVNPLITPIVYAHGVYNKQVFIIMRDAGMDLSNYINSNKLFESTLIQKFEFLRPILETLSRLHEAGFVHCDVKPENIVVYNMEMRLIDLEGVLDVRDKSQYSKECTTISRGYASPEVRGYYTKPRDVRKADIYSAGILVHDLLASQDVSIVKKNQARASLEDKKEFHGAIEQVVNNVTEQIIKEYKQDLVQSIAKIIVSYTMHVLASMLKDTPQERPSFKEVHDCISKSHDMLLAINSFQDEELKKINSNLIPNKNGKEIIDKKHFAELYRLIICDKVLTDSTADDNKYCGKDDNLHDSVDGDGNSDKGSQNKVLYIGQQPQKLNIPLLHFGSFGII